MKDDFLGKLAKKINKDDSNLSAALFRLASAVAVSGGDRAVEVLRTQGILKLCDEALNHATDIPEAYLDGALSVLEGVGHTNAGILHLCENGLLNLVLSLTRAPDVYVRIRSCHSLADLLEHLPAENSAVTAYIEESESAKGLIAKLLIMCQQPLLLEQRTAVFRLLSLFIRRMPVWAFKTSSLFNYITTSPDNQEDAAKWRYSMAQEALSLGQERLATFLTENEVSRLVKFSQNKQNARKDAHASTKDVAE